MLVRGPRQENVSLTVDWRIIPKLSPSNFELFWPSGNNIIFQWIPGPWGGKIHFLFQPMSAHQPQYQIGRAMAIQKYNTHHPHDEGQIGHPPGDGLHILFSKVQQWPETHDGKSQHSQHVQPFLQLHPARDGNQNIPHTPRLKLLAADTCTFPWQNVKRAQNFNRLHLPST